MLFSPSDYFIPALHPVVVHFPVVLLVISAATCLVWAFRPRQTWFRTGVLFQALGLAAAFAARRTGHILAEDVGETGLVGVLLPQHQLGANWIVALSAAALSIALVVILRDRRDPLRAYPVGWERLLLAVCAIAAAGLAAWTSHLGGLMVWGVSG